MKKRYLGLMAGIMLLAAGCASGNDAAGTVPANATEASAAESQEETAKEGTKNDGAKEGGEESLDAARESLKAAEESLKAVEESLKAVEESLNAEEESRQADRDTDYDKLKEDPEAYLKKPVKFSGRIIRSAAVGSSSVQIVLAVDGAEEDRVVGEYKKSIVDGTLSTGDTITISGEFQGIIRYRMQTGGSDSLPTVGIEKIENIVRKEPETTAATLQPSMNFPTADTQAVNVPETATAPVADAPTAEETAAASGENITEEETGSGTSPVISAGQ